MKWIVILIPFVACSANPAITHHVNHTNSSQTLFSESNSFSYNSSDFGSFNYHYNNTLKESRGITTFQKWIQFFDKKFNATEIKTFYKQNFDENVKFIMESVKLNLSFSLGVNAFTHLSSEEFVSNYCGTMPPEGYKVTSSTPILSERFLKNKWNNYSLKNLPKYVDWRKYVQQVINQKTCGSCWAFSAMAMIESHNMLRNSKWDYQLSPQYLVDCDSTNYRCEGGWPEKAAKWLRDKSSNEAPTLSDYPYINSNGTCRSKVRKVSLNIESFHTFKLDSDEEDLMLKLANYGPLAIAIFVSKRNKLFQLYDSGVFFDDDCPKSSINENQCEKVNHSVLLVGYGTSKKGVPYWLIKNSWGTSWGEDGYVRMIRNKNNNCNPACYATIVN